MRVQLQGYIPSVRLLVNTPVVIYVHDHVQKYTFIVIIRLPNQISLFKKIMKKHDDFIYVLKYPVVFRSYHSTYTQKISGSDIHPKKLSDFDIIQKYVSGFHMNNFFLSDSQ